MKTLTEQTQAFAPLALVKKMESVTKQEKNSKIVGFIPCPCIIKNVNPEKVEFEVEFLLDQVSCDIPDSLTFFSSNTVQTVATSIDGINMVCNFLTEELIKTTYNRKHFQAVMEARPYIRNYCDKLAEKKSYEQKKSLSKN